jgi:hypothetical protein
MSKFQFQVIINTPEDATHEHSEVIEANSYTEGMLRGYTRAVYEAEKFRRDNKMAKLTIDDINVYVKELVNVGT